MQECSYVFGKFPTEFGTIPCPGGTLRCGACPPIRRQVYGPGRCAPAKRASRRKNFRNSVGIFEAATPASRNGVAKQRPDSQTMQIAADDASANRCTPPSGVAATLPP